MLLPLFQLKTDQIEIFTRLREKERLHAIFERFLNDIVHCSEATGDTCVQIKRVDYLEANALIEGTFRRQIQEVGGFDEFRPQRVEVVIRGPSI